MVSRVQRCTIIYVPASGKDVHVYCVGLHVQIATKNDDTSSILCIHICFLRQAGLGGGGEELSFDHDYFRGEC